MAGTPSKNSTAASPRATSPPMSQKPGQKAVGVKDQASTAPTTAPFHSTGIRQASSRRGRSGVPPSRRQVRPTRAVHRPAASVARDPNTMSGRPAAERVLASAQPKNSPAAVHGSKKGSTHSTSETRNCTAP